ncbi:MAG: phosphotransferase [Anaerolineae bacterium]|nr:phosphotransferase [Anaerolineae bacterium]
MTQIALEDIETLARAESERMRHYYIGVEHLFIALTQLEGGITGGVLEQVGQSPRYVRYAIREAVGRGDGTRRWAGYHQTPRAERVLHEARRVIGIGTIRPDDRVLLLTILEEGDSLPVRLLRGARVDIDALWRTTIEWSGDVPHAGLPEKAIQGGDALNADERAVLAEMFRRYARIHVEQVFNAAAGAFSGTTVLLVRPQHPDGRSDARVVVKLDDRQAIMWEKNRYDSFVRDRLPAQTARIAADPTLPDGSHLAGLKYTFVRTAGDDLPTNLLRFVAEQPPDRVDAFLYNSLYRVFGETWWGQRQPYTFTAGLEYDLLLPPALVVEALDGDEVPTGVPAYSPGPDWPPRRTFTPGDIIALEGFAVVRARRERGMLRLASGAGAEASNYRGRIDVYNLNVDPRRYWRGEPVERLMVRVRQTREDVLQTRVALLEPDFDLMRETLPFAGSEGRARLIPNPLRAYGQVLASPIAGTTSTIHGDLHTGNILVGPGGDAWLIDFEWAREGHTLFDWAVLEVSLLLDHVAPCVGQSWAAVRMVAALLDALNQRRPLPPTAEPPIAEALRPVLAVRRIAAELLARESAPAEYFTALSMAALRASGWRERPLGARRLAYLASALAIEADWRARRTYEATTGDATADPTLGQGYDSLIDPAG